MAKKPPQPRRITDQRKLFIDAVASLGKYFDADGAFCGDSDEMADDICLLRDGSPKRILNEMDLFEWICGSAIYFLSLPETLRVLDECHETCRGGEVFQAVFSAGWSIGFESANPEIAKECKADRKKQIK